MNDDIAQRMAEAGITLPLASPPGGRYSPIVTDGDLLYASGQVAKEGGEVSVRGKLGDDVDLESGQAAARLAMLNLLAQIDVHVGLENVARVLKVNGYIATTPDFTRHAAVMDGASGVLAEVLGDAGAHARTSVGVASLPGNAPVEVEVVARFASASGQ